MLNLKYKNEIENHQGRDIMKKDPSKTHKIIFIICVIACVFSFVLFDLSLAPATNANNIIEVLPLIFLALGTVFLIIDVVLFIFISSQKTTRTTYDFHFSDFEECKSYIEKRLSDQEFVEHSHTKTKYGYDVFAFFTCSVSTEYYFIVKINQYLGADSLNDIPLTLINQYHKGINNMSLGNQENTVVLCFQEKSDLWYSDFLNIPLYNKRYNRFFYTAVDLNAGKIHTYEYKGHSPITCYQTMQINFENTMGINNAQKP